MAVKSFEIESYGVHLTDSLDLGSGLLAAGATSARMRGAIACKGSDHVFFMIFLAPGSSVPEAFYRPADKLGAIFLPFGDIAPYVDLLRNEKPLTAYLDSDKPWRNGVFTALEPVGEGELFSALLPQAATNRGLVADFRRSDRQLIVKADMRKLTRGHDFITVGNEASLSVDAETGFLAQFRHQDFLLLLIAHLHKAALLMP